MLAEAGLGRPLTHLLLHGPTESVVPAGRALVTVMEGSNQVMVDLAGNDQV